MTAAGGVSGADLAGAPPERAYKILTVEQWARFEAEGRFEGAPVDLADGYIHLSAADQVEATLARHFAGQSGLVLVEIDIGSLGKAVRWEPSRGGALFPHVYGVLPMSSVRAARAIP
jgi:beta-hydroxylase